MSGDTKAGPAKGCWTTVCLTVGGQTGNISELLGSKVAVVVGDGDMVGRIACVLEVGRLNF